MTRQNLLQEECKSISELGIQMLEQGLTTGTGGNISASDENGNMAISPTGMAYREITATDVPVLDPEDNIIFGDRDPSSEHRMHRMLHEDNEDVGGVVHTHSPYASAFASAGEPIPVRTI